MYKQRGIISTVTILLYYYGFIMLTALCIHTYISLFHGGGDGDVSNLQSPLPLK